MNARSHYTALSPPPAPFTSASSTRYPLPFLRSAFCIQIIGSCPHKQLRISNTAYFKFPRSFFPEAPHLSDDEDEGGGGGDDHDEDEEDTAAEEYEVELAEALGEVEVGDDEMEGSVAASEAAPRLKELKRQRVEKCRNEVREFGEEIIDVNELASIYDFRIDKFQRLAMEAFLRGSSVVVSAPTSSGKTLIAEAAAVATVSRGRRLFYTTPLKALSNQKFREFRETFGDSSVGLLTGDSAVNKDAQILIMTTEILRNMLYQSIGMVSSSSGLFHVDVIVLDEVHYLSDISRGTVWEEIIIYCPRELQLICLSATVANPDELAGWIGQIHGKTELVASSKRPVQLNWHFVTKIAMLPLLDKKGTSMNRKVSLNYLQHQDSGVTFNKDSGYRRKNAKRDFELSYSHQDEKSRLSKNEINTLRRSQAPQVKDVLWHLKKREMLPAIWFIFSRKGCDAAVQYLEDCNLLDECEKSEVELALIRFRVQHPDAVRNSALKGLLHGVAAHHAGCLPLWKSFIEVLFQRGLVKIVFATETLAAGMNMPARTAVIASMSRRNESGHVKLSPNQLLQMAGRAGRRGIDERGHVVLLQTPYDGAEQYSKLFFAGVEPLVSQFTASYGMVLNLLAGSKVIQRLSGSNEIKIHKAGRTLEEARKLIERSFGNYVGTNVMVSLKEELTKIQKEIEFLTMGVTDDAVDMKIRKQLSKKAYNEITDLHKEFEAGKYLRTEMWRRMESKRVSALKPLLKDLEHGHLPFICLQYADKNGIENTIPAVYLGKAHSLYGSTAKEMVDTNGPFIINDLKTEHDGDDTGHQQDIEISFYVALGSDNTWYLFSEKWIKKIYQTSLPNSALGEGDPLPREIMWKLLDKEDMLWEKLADSALGGLWGMDGSLETWSWSLNVPVLSSLLEEDEMFPMSQEYLAVVECYKEQRNKVSRIKKKITRTEGFKEYKKIIDMTKLTEENIRHLQVRSNRLIGRLEQIEPSGWKDFLQISGVIHECRALDINTQVIFPLGETAAAIRGENELWLAMVLRNKILLDLRPEQLAAVCGSLVSEGIKVRPSKNNSYIYEPSTTVFNIIRLLEEQRRSLSDIQEKHGVNIPCGLDSQFCGMVEAWASGISWREVMMDCAMDEGDLARLLRRTTDLLAQIPKLPDIDSRLQRCALTASDVMDRSPISELVG